MLKRLTIITNSSFHHNNVLHQNQAFASIQKLFKYISFVYKNLKISCVHCHKTIFFFNFKAIRKSWPTSRGALCVVIGRPSACGGGAHAL